jgi:hypothetical protein
MLFQARELAAKLSSDLQDAADKRAKDQQDAADQVRMNQISKGCDPHTQLTWSLLAISQKDVETKRKVEFRQQRDEERAVVSGVMSLESCIHWHGRCCCRRRLSTKRAWSRSVLPSFGARAAEPASTVCRRRSRRLRSG